MQQMIRFITTIELAKKVYFGIFSNTTQVVVYLCVCKTSYHLLISPTPINLPNTLKIHTGENKIDHWGR